MPIVYSVRTTQVFLKAAWIGVEEERKEIWRDKARSILYPDLRTAYNLHAEMIETMAQALYECSVYSKHGGGRRQTGTNDTRAIYEVEDGNDARYEIKAMKDPHTRNASYYKHGKLNKSIDPNAPHPMGDPVPGHYFAFVDKVQHVTYHALTIKDVENEQEATEVAEWLVKEGYPAAKTVSTMKTDINIRPMREKHVENNTNSRYDSDLRTASE